MSYLVNGLEFATKEALQEEIKRILYKYEPEMILDCADTDFMCDVLFMHPHADEKIGKGVQSIGVQINPTYRNTRNFVVYRTDGTSSDFSYTKCLRPPTHRAMLIQACRQAIAPGIIAAKQSYFRQTVNPVCPITNEFLTPENTHVDHAYPKTFRNLFERFIREHHVNMDKVELVRGGDNSSIVQIADKMLESLWVSFHWQEAEIRFISAEANLLIHDKDPSLVFALWEQQKNEAFPPSEPVSEWVKEKIRADMKAMGYTRVTDASGKETVL